jgi:hypothetical protein
VEGVDLGRHADERSEPARAPSPSVFLEPFRYMPVPPATHVS